MHLGEKKRKPMNSVRIVLASASPRRRFLLKQIGLRFDVYPADIGETLSPGADPAEAVKLLSLEKAQHVANCGLWNAIPDDGAKKGPINDPSDNDAKKARINDSSENDQNRVRINDSSDGDERKTLIIGADTIVVLDGVILGKPSTPSHAADMLASLSGRTHQVYTGVALLVVEGDDHGKNKSLSGGDGYSGRYAKGIIRHVFHERTDVTFGPLSEQEIKAYVDGGSPMDKAGAYGIQDDLGALFVQRIDGDYYNVVGFPLYRFYREVNKLAPGIVTPFKPTK